MTALPDLYLDTEPATRGPTGHLAGEAEKRTRPVTKQAVHDYLDRVDETPKFS